MHNIGAPESILGPQLWVDRERGTRPIKKHRSTGQQTLANAILGAGRDKPDAIEGCYFVLFHNSL